MKNGFLFSVMLVFILVLNFVGCDMENSGYQLEWYKITSLTYNNRPTGSTPEEHLSYVKNASGTGSKSTGWFNSYDLLEEKILEISGTFSISNDLRTTIQGQYTSAAYGYPGLFSLTSDYWFFYIKNNNNK